MNGTAQPARHSRTWAARWSAGVATALLVGLPAPALADTASAAGSTPAPATAPAPTAPKATSTPTATPAPKTTATLKATPEKQSYKKLGARTLRRGDRGKDVKKLQKLLGVKRTGHFNKRTGKAVRKVERKYDLTVDTVVDARTLKAVKKYAKARKARKAKSSRSVERVGSPAAAKRYARSYIDKKYGWGDRQMGCLVSIWTRESHWNYRASNPNGRYHGIPQTSSAVWSAHGYSRSEYMGSAKVQVKVGAKYIEGRYSTPCSAWSFWKSHHWY